MKIGFDGKRIYQNQTGLGNYCRTLFLNLNEYFPENEYQIFAHKQFTKNSIFNRHQFLSKTFIKEGGNDKSWRTKGIVKDLIAQNVSIYHGLSHEIPFGLPKTIKSIVTIHDLIFLKKSKYYNFFDRYIYKAKIKKACNKSDAIIAISEQTKNDLIEQLNVPADKISVIYQTYGKEYETLFTYETKEIWRKKMHLPEQYLLFVGNGNKRKRLDLVLEALNQPELKDIPLVIVGNKKLEKARKYIDKHKMNRRVFFLDNIKSYDLPVVYAMAKGLIYPSEYEGFGLPILEAQKIGIPVITNKNSAIVEVAGDGCFFFNHFTKEDIADSIKAMFSNDEDLNIRGEKNTLFIKKFEPLHATKQILDIYKSVL